MKLNHEDSLPSLAEKNRSRNLPAGTYFSGFWLHNINDLRDLEMEPGQLCTPVLSRALSHLQKQIFPRAVPEHAHVHPSLYVGTKRMLMLNCNVKKCCINHVLILIFCNPLFSFSVLEWSKTYWFCWSFSFFCCKSSVLPCFLFSFLICYPPSLIVIILIIIMGHFLTSQ